MIGILSIVHTYGNDVLMDSMPIQPTPSSDTLTTLAMPIDMMDSTMLAHIDQALAWIDTTQCNSDTIIYTLTDSVYKARLQSLPFVIEMPYNPVVGRYMRYTTFLTN